MASSDLRNYSFFLCLSLLLFLPSCINGSYTPKVVDIKYHNGTMLTGKVKLALIWYGGFGRVQKNTVRSFIKSLNYNDGANLRPQVHAWWQVVESYQKAAGLPAKPIVVEVVKQVVDNQYTAGKVLTVDNFGDIAGKGIQGDKSTIALIMTARDVTVQGTCTGKCGIHGTLADGTMYMVVGNPELICPAACSWPFHQRSSDANEKLLLPPNKDISSDAMVIALAQTLAEIVTNPKDTGFFEDTLKESIEIASACQYKLGSEGSPVSFGQLLTDPTTGASYNAHGSRGRKFIVPAIWNIKTKSCYTIM